jgi:hypothetical protein
MSFSALLNSCGKSLLALAMACTGFAVNVTRGEITTIALTGDPAPDGDGTLATLHLPVLNDRGWVAFESRTSGHANLFHPEVLLMGDGTNLIQIARGGFEDENNYRVPAFNEKGQTAISGSTDILTQQPGPLRADTNGVTFYAQLMDPDPDGLGLFETLGRLSLNDVGWAAFNGSVEIDRFTRRVGVYVSDGSNLTSYALDGELAPNTTNVFTGFNLPAINNAGWVAFLADQIGDDSGDGANEGVFLANSTSIEVLARHGDPAPGGGVFREFLQPVLNAVGQVAVYARLEGVGAGPRGIYLADTSSIEAVALEDQLMPDGDGVLAAFTQPVLNDVGQVAFIGFEEGAMNRGNGLFLTVDGVLTEVVRANDPAPEGGGSFVFFSSGADYTPVINNRGQLAFRADFAITRDLDEGIVFRDVDGTLHLVARDGQSLAGSTVTALGLLGSDWVGLERDFGGRKALNELGQVAFHAALADGRQGIFLWNRLGLRITEFRLDGGDAVMRVTSVPGSTYQLQRSDSLRLGQWQDIGPSVAGTGGDVELRQTNPGTFSSQFYRVEVR